jgi:16S rRNA (uracil1498-N3)-methyltransferase
MRQLIIEKNLDKNGLVHIDGKDFHYLRQVLRVKAGDMVKLRLPDGTLENTTVCKIDDKSKIITLQVCATSEPVEGPSIEFSLFQFIPKPQKLELIVRQATECGVKNIIPVISEYAQKGNVEALMGSKKERLERIIREARQQSGSPVDTVIFDPVTVEQAVELWNKMKEEAGETDASAGFVLSEHAVPEPVERPSKGGASTGSATPVVPEPVEGPKAVAIFCGNEGGISPDELELLTKKALLYPVHFSVNILRCETAALYGIAAIQSAILGF